MQKVGRIIVVALLLVIALAGCGGDEKDDSDETKMVKIGILNPIGVFDPAIDGLKNGLASQGFIEGRTVTYVYNGPVNAFEVEALAEAAKPLVEAEVDVIVTFATPGGLAAQQASGGIPIVFGFVTDPVGAGLVDDWQTPGGNITGVANPNPETQELRLLVRLVPTIKRVYVPMNEDNQPSYVALEAMTEAANSLGVTLVTVPASTPEEIEAAAANAPEDIDAIFIMPDLLTASEEYESLWGALAEARGIPLSYPGGAGASVAVMTYGSEMYPSGQQMARLVGQVLNGIAPGDLPVEQEEFQLTLYLPNAERYGIEVPDDLLRMADTIKRAE